MNEVVSLLCESEVGDRAALDQHSTSTRAALEQRKRIRIGSLENLMRTSSKLATSSRFVNKIINSQKMLRLWEQISPIGSLDPHSK